MNVRETKLGNGLRVITAAMPEVESVSIGIWVGVGARYEDAPMSGVSHFIEHLLFKGTRRRSAGEISNAIEGRGGHLNAFTQEESTCFYARVAHEDAAHAMDVLADMFLNSVFAPGELDKERGVIVEEIMMYRDQPQQLVEELLGEALWKDHALGRPISGQPETVRAMSRDAVVSFMRSKYVADSTVVAVAGRLDHDACVRLAERRFGGLAGGPRPQCAPVGDGAAQCRVRTVSRDIEQNHLAMGLRVFGRDDPRRYPLKVLCTVLGGNMSSRLFQVVREKHGLAYSIHSGTHLFRDSGALAISAGLDRKRAMKALDLILRELVRLRERPVSAAELRRARDFLIGQLKLSLENTSSQMMWIGDNLITRERFVPPQELVDAIAAVSAEDVQRIAREVLVGRRLSLAMVAPGLDDAMGARIGDALAALPQDYTS
jgi:predicted Zn-dependent peptidase